MLLQQRQLNSDKWIKKKPLLLTLRNMILLRLELMQRQISFLYLNDFMYILKQQGLVYPCYFKFQRRCFVIIGSVRVNGEIKEKEVRVIGADGSQLGIVATKKALEIAEEQKLDLVEVAPNSKPVVCRIMDYGKFKYEKGKKEKEAKKKQNSNSKRSKIKTKN
eukprot:TRINITY_DN14531_c0_g2_i1.p3 TRINITY_DN14531_c0_g2~~TRINITY_DN14531_c0_g2_i1.p3  ORF type:complete len:163 (-),score=9.70 TRINITY_DN14531_c0_g2_i1:404-892(-)